MTLLTFTCPSHPVPWLPAKQHNRSFNPVGALLTSDLRQNMRSQAPIRKILNFSLPDARESHRSAVEILQRNGPARPSRAIDWIAVKKVCASPPAQAAALPRQ